MKKTYFEELHDMMNKGTRFLTEEILGAIQDGIKFEPVKFTDILATADRFMHNAYIRDGIDQSLTYITGMVLDTYSECDHYNNELENVFHRLAGLLDGMYTKQLVETDNIPGSSYKYSFNAFRSDLRDTFHMSNSFEYDKYELGFKTDKEIYDILDNCLQELKRR